jgi:OOP family OmpA-OmpF porin
MAQSRELTGHGNQAAPAEQRLWVREADERWSFWWRGALPVLSLAAVLAYNMSAFAQKTETQVRLGIAEDLAKQDLSWVQVETDGQHVRLSGAPPSADASARALAIASKTTCQSWLGKLTCARSVTTRFTNANGEPGTTRSESGKPTLERELDSTTNAAAVEPRAAVEPIAAASAATNAAPEAVAASALAVAADAPAVAAGQRWFDLTVVRTGNVLKLKGDVASSDARSALEQTARTHFPSGTLDNQLAVIGGDVSPDWEGAAKRAVEVATRCEQGVISLTNATLSVDCETQTASARDTITELVKQELPGLTAGNMSVLALDEVKSCEAGLVKLVTRSQVRFTTNSAKLLPTSRPLLREITHQLERCPGVVVVEGHTDAQGVREENVTLSLNRARAVVSGLVGLGVPAARVRAEGFGPDQPLATNETATGRAQNRRIEFRVARTGIRGE